MDKHTPGPWIVRTDLQFDHGGAIVSSTYDCYDNCSNLVAICDVQSMPNAANARLIAAAPDMLAALEIISQSWPAHDSESASPVADAMAAKARAAIAKARGQ